LVICCVVVFCAGIGLFLYGFRLLKRPPSGLSTARGSYPFNAGMSETDFDPGTRQSLAQATALQPSVINLSTDAGPTNSAEMTQQQRIAAALVKAGISNPAAWAAAGIPNGSPAVVIPDSLATPNARVQEEKPQKGAAATNLDVQPPTVPRDREGN